MLIGIVLFFSTHTKKRLEMMDADVTADHASRASGRETIAQWSCRNGDPKDVRYFLNGRQIDEEEAARRLGWGQPSL